MKRATKAAAAPEPSPVRAAPPSELPAEPACASPGESPSDARLGVLRDEIIAWFQRGHRDLPWRRVRDPYAVWVSEIMLQQTRVETVKPRFVRWMERFPSAGHLAAAPLDDVLAEWAGLGYYARARNLHAAARVVTEEYGGRVPDEPEAVLALPGVGRYTAGAILSIAYGRRVPILDGNVERVLSRLFCVDGDPARADVRARLWSLAERLVEGAGDPSALNQGLMELGAVVCSPRRPACLACPLVRSCEARARGAAESYPGPTRKQKITAVEMAAVALVRDGQVLACRRPPEGLWGGLFELPSGELLVGETPLGAAVRIARERAGLSIDLASVRPFAPPDDRFVQELSHLRITFHAFVAEAPRGRVRRAGYDAHKWLDLSRVQLVGIARTTHRLLAALRGAAAPSSPRRSR